ncbi:hypothetical protein EHM69_03090 [candidate division KSB1 bacterium]|nr:MAG: hypothetical protein EHM69_03090 [candidate division KSB1 bacterium]
MFLTRFAKTVLILGVAAVLLLTSAGCSSRPSAAQKLFDKGEYQKVIDKYPDLEIARRAAAKLADKLLQEKQFEQVIQQYPLTPAAFKAKMELAQKLFDAGDFSAVIEQYPNSPLVTMCKMRMADSLLMSGQLDQLLQRFPDTPQAKKIKEDRATEALNKAKKLKGQARQAALEEITRSFAGTTAYKEAADLLGKMRQTKPK